MSVQYVLIPCLTHIHITAFASTGIAKLLLNWDKDLVNGKDINGSTPMHFAASAADPSLQFTSFVFTESTFERHFLGSNFLPQKCLTKVYTWRELPLPQLLKADPSLASVPD
jgi:ankyrin repeat protein